MAECLNATKSNSSINGKKSRKRRVRLSCTGCRKKKLSCDRTLPCQRCVKSGRPEQCSFETASESLPEQEIQLRNLQAEVTELKELLSKALQPHGTNSNAGFSHTVDHIESDRPIMSNGTLQERGYLINNTYGREDALVIDKSQPRQPTTYIKKTGLLDPKERTPRGYYSRHNLFQFFDEIPELFPFVKETIDEWIEPFGVKITKDKSIKKGRGIGFIFQKDAMLESLLPPKDDTDVLVSLYLDGMEQIHRIIHIPTFKREYTNFWTPGRARYPAMTALILAMLSISTCATTRSAEATSIASKYHAMCTRWISACEKWLKQQSLKRRELVHYQISCLTYLAKRVNMIGKKRWWKETSSLIQDAIMDGLNCASSPTTSTPYAREMKRRVWATLRELDLQNAFEYGLPSLLHNIDPDVSAPMNLDDDDFGETSESITPKPLRNYTLTSYQVHGSRSWPLRLEISRRLFGGGNSEALRYDEVLRYTHEITQAIEAIPSWGGEDASAEGGPGLPIVTSSFLHFQLMECILALHRPYLHRNGGKYWLSETVCYQTSRDILVLIRRLEESGYHGLMMIREDLLLASLSLVRITILQPKGRSTSIAVGDSQLTVELLEQCLPFIEDRHLRCHYSELWCFITMCAAILLLKIHLGQESRQTAKACCARRFLDLHDRQLERQKLSLPEQQCQAPLDDLGHVDVATDRPGISSIPSFLVSELSGDVYPELYNIDSLYLDGTGRTWDI